MKHELFNSNHHNLTSNETIIFNEDVWYSCDAHEFIEDLEYSYDVVSLNNFKNLRDIGIDIRGNDVFILKGTKAKFLDNFAGNWPTFDFGKGLALTFCGEEFEIIRAE